MTRSQLEGVRQEQTCSGVKCSLWPLWSAVALAPLLRSSVDPWAQAILGLLLGVGCLMMAREGGQGGTRGWMLGIAAFALLSLWLVPLPLPLIEFLSPERAALAAAFPVDAGRPPGWASVTVSPGDTVTRLWELLLCGVVFGMAWMAGARQGARAMEGLVRVLRGTIVALLAAEFWRRMDGGGPWRFDWPVSAATFPNRNHFASWTLAAMCLCFGKLLASGWRDRRGRPRWALVVILLAGAGAVAASGSRGGIIAGAMGVAFLGVLLKWQSTSRRAHRRFLTGAAALVVSVAFAGGFLWERFMGSWESADLKWSIWRDTWGIIQQFPLTGTGWGTFSSAFAPYKTFGGDLHFWHAENDYLQLAMEGGLLGLAAAAAVGIWWLRRIKLGLERVESRERIWLAGACSGLLVLILHGLVDFPFQVMANLTLVAALAGLTLGIASTGGAPRFHNVAALKWLGVVIILAASLQGGSSVLWWTASHMDDSELRRHALLKWSWQLWPMETRRALGLARTEIEKDGATGETIAAGSQARSWLTRALRWDPLDWELRLERAWIDLVLLDELERGKDEAMMASRLNPQSAQAPLLVAGWLIPRDVDGAMQFLDRAASDNREIWLRKWRMILEAGKDPAELWRHTPATREGLRELAGFALGRRLPEIAAQALIRLEGVEEPKWLAKKFLAAGRADLAVHVLEGKTRENEEIVLLSRAYWLLGDHERSLGLSRPIWEERLGDAIYFPFSRPGASLAELRERWIRSRNREAGLQLAEMMFAAPAGERDAAELQRIFNQNPNEARIGWILFKTQLDLDNLPESAATSLRLAEQVR